MSVQIWLSLWAHGIKIKENTMLPKTFSEELELPQNEYEPLVLLNIVRCTITKLNSPVKLDLAV